MKHTLIIAGLGIAAGYFFVVMFALALFWPSKTILIRNYSEAHPIPLETTALYPGDTLTYQLSYCKYSDKTSTVKRELIDGQIITLPDISGQLPMGCNTTRVSSVVIPETLVPGKYRLSVSIDYPINPIHDAFFGQQRTRYTTEYFTVLAKTQPATAVIYGVPTTVYIKPADPVATPTPKNESPVIINNTVSPKSSQDTTTSTRDPDPSPSSNGLGGVLNSVSGLLH